MNFLDECLRFDCAGESLLGVLSRPEQPSTIGLLIIVGGPQYRAGSHRQFVLLARHLAAAGHAVLRFDYRGMGDSNGAERNFEAVSDDIDAAMAALRQAVPGLQQVALWGLCDGASAALLYLQDRPQAEVAGLCLLNPWVRSAQTQASTRVKHYYTGRLMEKAFWSKLLRGQVNVGRLSELAANLRTMLRRRPPSTAAAAAAAAAALSFHQRMAQSWQRHDMPLMLVLSGRDLIAKEFLEAASASPDWQGALARPQLTRLDLPKADHTFADTASREAVQQATCAWLGQLSNTAASTGQTQPGTPPDTPAETRPPAAGFAAAGFAAAGFAAAGAPQAAPPKAMLTWHSPDGWSVTRQPMAAPWPEDVQALVTQAVRFNLESSQHWYRNLHQTMFNGDDKIALWILRDGASAVAALPVRVEARRWGGHLWPLIHPHYTALFTPTLAPGLAAEKLSLLLRQVLGHYRPLGRLTFSPMDMRSDGFACLKRALALAGLRCFSFFCFMNWHLRAPANWADYLAGRSANQRSVIRRSGRKLAQQGGHIEIITEPSDLDRGMAAYWQVYATSWKQDEPSHAFIDGLARSCASHGELRLGLAWLGERPVAAQLWMVGRGQADIYKLAYDEAFKALAPGNALSAALMQHVIECDQVHRVDYLIGDDAYKRVWMSEQVERWGLVAFNPWTATGLAGAIAQRLAEHTRSWRARRRHAAQASA